MHRALTALALAVLVQSCSCGPTPPRPPNCTRRTCQAGDCGEQLDGCNGILRCGGCPQGETCGGGGTPNVCAAGTCSPKTCVELGKNCDFVSDGCSKLLDCGRCRRPSDCGQFGMPSNVCGGPSCVRQTCEGLCGIGLVDGCGGLLQCDAACTSPFHTCGGGSEPNRCGCTPRSCNEQRKNCGTIQDGCGRPLDCGSCSPDAGTCGGLGVENVCGVCRDQEGRICTGSCWCWEQPRPFGSPIGALAGAGGEVWALTGGGGFIRFAAGTTNGWPSLVGATPRNAFARASNDIYAVTDQFGANVLHFDGRGWAAEQTGTPEPLNGIWGLPGEELWAAGGNGTVLRKPAGGIWQKLVEGGGYTFEDVWASAPNDVWVGGTALRHFDGQSWSLDTSFPRIFDLHGTARADVWMVDLFAVRHFDGTRWTFRYGPTAGNPVAAMRRVWAIAPDDVWFGGERGRLVHYDGRGFQEQSLGVSASVTALWAGGPNDVWVAAGSLLFQKTTGGFRALTSLPGRDLADVWVSTSGEGWAVGDEGRLLRRVDAGWTRVELASEHPLHAISGAGGRAWAVGTGVIFGLRDGGWSLEHADRALTFVAVAAVSEAEAWAVANGVGPSTLWRTDGTSWASVPTAGSLSGNSSALWAEPDSVFVGAAGARVDWLDDGGWHRALLGSGGQINGLWGSQGERYAASSSGIAYRADPDGGWRPLFSAVVPLNAVWGRSPADVWFAGNNGLLMRWNGASAASAPTGTLGNLNGLYGTSTQAWGVGPQSTIMRLEEAREPVLEEVLDARLDDMLNGVTGFANGAVWAVGESGATYRFDGQRWRRDALLAPGLVAAAAVEPNTLWVVSRNNRSFRHDGTQWAEVPTQQSALTFTSLYAAAPNAVWASAGNRLARWNGSQWQTETTAVPVNGVFGLGPNDVWAVGRGAQHFNGNRWVSYPFPLPTHEARTVWCRATDDCWAAGPGAAGGTLLRWNGMQWSVAPPVPGPPDVVWGRARDDVFVFTTDAQLFHWNGAHFKPQRTGSTEPIRAAWSSDAGMWAVGRRTLLFQAP